MMQLNNLPYLKPLQPHTRARSCARDVMDTSIAALRCPCTYLDVHFLLSQARDTPRYAEMRAGCARDARGMRMHLGPDPIARNRGIGRWAPRCTSSQS